MPNSPQAEYEVAMIEAYLKDTLDEESLDIYDVPEMALEVWRITKTAKRPVKDNSWRK